MDETTFWQMIEQAKSEWSNDSFARAGVLIRELTDLDFNEIVDYDFLFRQHLVKAYRCDLWEAARIVEGEVRPEAFRDFRAWLVSHGRDIYEQVLSDPDWLAQIADYEEDDEGELRLTIRQPRMIIVARYAYDAKFGVTDAVFPHIPMEQPQLVGDWCAEDELPYKYPNLWALFRHDAD